jgi:hypothetical protein
LDAGFEVSSDEMAVIVSISRCGVRKGKIESACCMTEYGFENDTTAVIGIGDDLVSWNEWERDPIVEIRRRVTLDEG